MLLRYLLTLCLLHTALSQRRPASRPLPPSNPSSNPEATDIISQVSDISPDGSFYTKWETANGISYEERGQPKQISKDEIAESVQGRASWTTKEGEQISISWTADESGANFQGDHLPTPPPTPEIPPLIQRALEWIAAHPSKLSVDEEGQYKEEGQAAPSLARKPPAPGRRI